MQRTQTTEEFLSSQQVIRIHFDSMPYGAGNQVSSQHILERLRELGFKGKYEVLYNIGFMPDYADGNPDKNIYITKEKIIKLFNLPADIPDLYYDEDMKIEFIDGRVFYERKNKNEVAHYTIAFTGGQLKFCPETVLNGLDIIKTQKELDDISCQNDANALEVDLHVRMEPWSGENPKKNLSNLRLFIHGQQNPLPLENNKHSFFKVPKSFTLDEVVAFLKDTKQSSKLTKQTPGLLGLIKGSREKTFHVMPFYGRPIKSEYDNEKNVQIESFSTYKLLHYIIGVKLAKNNATCGLHDKPIVLPVFYDYKKELRSLKKLIKAFYDINSDVSVSIKSDSIKKLIQDLELDKCLVIKDMSIEGERMEEIFQNLTSDKILLVSIGELPTKVFNSIYAKTATLPPVLEGENTMKLLMSETNKPFLRSLSWFFSPNSYGFKEYYPNDKLLKRYADYDSQFFISSWDAFIKSAEWVKQFIIDSLDEKSEICQYFRWLHEKAINPENDRLIYTLNKAIEILTEYKKIPLITEKSLTTEKPTYSSTNFITRALNNLCNTVLGRMTNYAREVVQECPNYFDPNINLSSSHKNHIPMPVNMLMFLNVNNTCIPCLPEPPTIGLLGP